MCRRCNVAPGLFEDRVNDPYKLFESLAFVIVQVDNRHRFLKYGEHRSNGRFKMVRFFPRRKNGALYNRNRARNSRWMGGIGPAKPPGFGCGGG